MTSETTAQEAARELVEEIKSLVRERPTAANSYMLKLWGNLEAKIAAALASQAPQVAAGEAAADPYEPMLVRDLAHELGVSPIDVQKALRRLGFGESSVNMAVTRSMARAVRREFATTPAPAVAEPTKEMITAYLTANDAYWREVDALPRHPAKWRNGTPSEATRAGLRAALAVSHAQPLKDHK